MGGAEPAGGRAGPEGRQHLTPGARPPSHLLLHLPEQAPPAPSVRLCEFWSSVFVVPLWKYCHSHQNTRKINPWAHSAKILK